MKKFAYLILFIAAACLTTGLVSCGVKAGEEEESLITVGAIGMEPTEPETEAPTEPETEPPTEAPTEVPTQPATEPLTEAPTEPEVEITIKARDTMLEGTPVDFTLRNDNNPGYLDPSLRDKELFVSITVPIQNGTKFDNKRGIVLLVVRSFNEFREAASIFKEKDWLSEYDEQYFQNNVLIMLYGTAPYLGLGWSVEEVKKDGAELCLGLADKVTLPDAIYLCAIQDIQQRIEISRADFDGIDTISIFDRAINTQ
ncbi:MAG: hypothetical protein HFE78_04140 [Clostridiales bacterium]|nr:hypothetical protein [Clostridiales bacterium]